MSRARALKQANRNSQWYVVRNRLKSDEDFHAECWIRGIVSARRRGVPREQLEELRFEDLDRRLQKTIACRYAVDEYRKEQRRMQAEEEFAEDLANHDAITKLEDESTMVRRLDLKRAFDQLIAKYGRPACDAAAGFISANEAARLMTRRKSDVHRLVEEANEEAKVLLNDYADVLPHDLQHKYAA